MKYLGLPILTSTRLLIKTQTQDLDFLVIKLKHTANMKRLNILQTKAHVAYMGFAKMGADGAMNSLPPQILNVGSNT